MWGTKMKFYEYGKENKITILLIPGNMMTYRQFEKIVPMLEQKYHVVSVSLDGLDESGETEYTTAEKQAEKLIAYIKENLNSKIDLIFAESLGSAPALFMTQSEEISIGGIILSGAEYLNYGILNPLFLKFSTAVTYNMLSGITKKGTFEAPAFLLKKLGRKQEDLDCLIGQLCRNISRETINNTFHEGIILYQYVAKWNPKTIIPMECWYGEKESDMKKAIKELQRAFPNIKIHPFKGLGHGEIINNERILVEEAEKFLFTYCRISE